MWSPAAGPSGHKLIYCGTHRRLLFGEKKFFLPCAPPRPHWGFVNLRFSSSALTSGPSRLRQRARAHRPVADKPVPPALLGCGQPLSIRVLRGHRGSGGRWPSKGRVHVQLPLPSHRLRRSRRPFDAPSPRLLLSPPSRPSAGSLSVLTVPRRHCP